MPGTGVSSYTNYKMSAKYNPYLEPIQQKEDALKTMNTTLRGLIKYDVKEVKARAMSNARSNTVK